jgi:hypothetical protein
LPADLVGLELSRLEALAFTAQLHQVAARAELINAQTRQWRGRAT